MLIYVTIIYTNLFSMETVLHIRSFWTHLLEPSRSRAWQGWTSIIIALFLLKSILLLRMKMVFYPLARHGYPILLRD